MALRERKSLGVRLVLVLAALAGLFTIVVIKTYRERERMVAQVNEDLRLTREQFRQTVDGWYGDVAAAQARQLATPFLWDVETLEGVREGTSEFNHLQRRMWQFVYGRDTLPAWLDHPVGPLESVLIIDRHNRIVAASDPMVVDKVFTDEAELEVLAAAQQQPKVRPLAPRSDGQPVVELTTAVPNARGELIGTVRMRYVGSPLQQAPPLPPVEFKPPPQLLTPLLAGLVALLGVGFGAIATWQVLTLARRLENLAHGVRLPPASGPGETALKVIEEKLGQLSDAAKRDDMLLDSLSEALREGVILLDPTGQPVVVSRQAETALLARPVDDEEELTGEIGSLLRDHPELAAIVDEGVRRGQAVRERPVTLTTADGQARQVQVTSYVMHDGAKTAGVMLVLRDRGSIDALEHNLREASRLAAIGMLTRSIAHEVKNPLGAMGIHLEHLRRRLTKLEEADPGAEERIRVIREEIERLREILQEWLHLTAPEERTGGEASVEDVLDSVARLLKVEARHQNVELIVERFGELGAVPMSTGALRQVLLNLALNALQAMPDGGRLELSAHSQADKVVLDICDTGAGIPDEIRERVFDFHFTTRHGGSGLGLAICKRLIESAGGTIGFTSTAGQGTVFRLELPSRNAALRAEAV